MDEKQLQTREVIQNVDGEKTVTAWWVSRCVTIGISALGLAYLIAIPIGIISADHKLGMVEAVIFAAILIFNSGLIRRLEKIAISDKGFEIQLEQVQVKQEQQQLQIKSLQFLLTNFLPANELGHLWGLKDQKPFPFKKSSWFEAELRHLRGMGLIAAVGPHIPIAGLPPEGNLKDFFTITDAGETYLGFKQQFENINQDLET